MWGNTTKKPHWDHGIDCSLSFLLRCLGKRRGGVLDQTVVQARWDLCFTPSPIDAAPTAHQPSKDQSQPPPQGYATPLLTAVFVYGDGSSEVPWPLRLNLLLSSFFLCAMWGNTSPQQKPPWEFKQNVASPLRTSCNFVTPSLNFSSNLSKTSILYQSQICQNLMATFSQKMTLCSEIAPLQETEGRFLSWYFRV